MEDTKKEPSFQCHNCKLLCRSKRQLHFHIDKCLREKKNQDKFKCFLCNESFIDQRSLFRHQAESCCKEKPQTQLYQYKSRLPFATLTNANFYNDHLSLSPCKEDSFCNHMEAHNYPDNTEDTYFDTCNNMKANIFSDNTQDTYFDTYNKSLQRSDFTDLATKYIDNGCYLNISMFVL